LAEASGSFDDESVQPCPASLSCRNVVEFERLDSVVHLHF